MVDSLSPVIINILDKPLDKLIQKFCKLKTENTVWELAIHCTHSLCNMFKNKI